MKSGVLSLLLSMVFGTSHAEVPKLFREREFSAADFAEAVNHFVALREESAMRELARLAPDWFTGQFSKGGFSLPERVGWVCRVLFEPEGKEPLRPPGYGALGLPYHSMPPASWPFYPVAASGRSYFVLNEGSTLFGVPEDPAKYLAYCRSEGVFRREPIAVPTREEAQQDAAALRESPAWKTIKWKDSGHGWSYTIREDWVWGFIQRQADSIK